MTASVRESPGVWLGLGLVKLMTYRKISAKLGGVELKLGADGDHGACSGTVGLCLDGDRADLEVLGRPKRPSPHLERVWRSEAPAPQVS